MWNEYLERVTNGDDQDYRLSIMNPTAPNFDATMALLWFNYVLKEFEKHCRQLASGPNAASGNTTINETDNDDDNDDDDDVPTAAGSIYVGAASH
jgi:hypothetical protein